MGGKLRAKIRAKIKLVSRKSDFRGPAGTSKYDFGETTPSPRGPIAYKIETNGTRPEREDRLRLLDNCCM